MNRPIVALTLASILLFSSTSSVFASTLQNWWPTNNVQVSGTQPFKALLTDHNVESYNMYWQVDGGQLNFMASNYTDYPHKEATVDLTTWRWDGNGPYQINFIAQDFSGNILGNLTVPIYISQAVSPTPTPIPPTQTSSPAYNNWKSQYVKNGPTGLRVVRPENNSDTVSEGMGYGMLLSAFANDYQTFSGLNNYVKTHLDQNGLMNWQIDSSGKTIGSGSAMDADEDIAYALLRGEQLWPGNNFGNQAKQMLSAILNTEIQPSGIIKPGDSWGDTQIVNPSYISPAYYQAFANFTGNSRWNDIKNINNQWLLKTADPRTGLLPDWSIPVSWDQYPNGFYYDAIRVPIRLFMSWKWNQDSVAQQILTKQNNFLASQPNLVSGYSLTGSPLTNYLNLAFLSAYAAAAQINSSSAFANNLLSKLKTSSEQNYFGTTLQVLTMDLISGSR